MRITGGSLRGRLLRAPAGRATRPTSSKVRQAIFNILGERITGARVLDLFAGSGALGIEALSRGAQFAAFVESSPGAARAIAGNVEELELRDRALVARDSASGGLERLSEAGERFDVVFLDPPYAGHAAANALAAIADSGVLAPDAVVVVEHTKRLKLSDRFGSLALVLSRRYGDTSVSVFALSRGKTGRAGSGLGTAPASPGSPETIARSAIRKGGSE
jgi:16S rRNA (guanine(966)-N(2))-methyltransferase RsmD